MHRRNCTVIALVGALAAVAPQQALAQLAVEHDSATVAEIAGNGNGVAEPGETLALTERLLSAEFTTLTGVAGTLSSASPDVVVQSSQSAWPDLAFGSPAAPLTPFTFGLAAAADCGARLPFALALTTSAGDVAISFSVPTGSAGAAAGHESADVPRPIPDRGSASSVIEVASTGRVKGLVVRVGRLTHPYIGDIRLEVVAPDGRSVVLVNRRGGGGADLVGTVFDDAAAASIRSSVSVPPFTGSFRPEQALSTLDGTPLAGTWTLRASDLVLGNTGGVEAWGMDVAPAVCAGPAPDPEPAWRPPGHDHRSDKARGQWPAPPGRAIGRK